MFCVGHFLTRLDYKPADRGVCTLRTCTRRKRNVTELLIVKIFQLPQPADSFQAHNPEDCGSYHPSLHFNCLLLIQGLRTRILRRLPAEKYRAVSRVRMYDTGDLQERTTDSDTREIVHLVMIKGRRTMRPLHYIWQRGSDVSTAIGKKGKSHIYNVH